MKHDDATMMLRLFLGRTYFGIPSCRKRELLQLLEHLPPSATMREFEQHLRTLRAQAEERAKALRVLRPGGRLTIVDIEHTRDYAELLRESGLTDVSRSRPNFLFIIPTHVVTGQKPGPSG